MKIKIVIDTVNMTIKNIPLAEEHKRDVDVSVASDASAEEMAEKVLSRLMRGKISNGAC